LNQDAGTNAVTHSIPAFLTFAVTAELRELP
jgi:hypothetical protein